MLNITGWLKTADDRIGPFLLKCISKVSKKNPEDMRVSSILVIRPGGIGDAALLLPALKATLIQNKKTVIDVLCEPRNMGVFKAVPFVTNIYSYRSFSDLFTVYKKKYDLIVDTEQSYILSAIVTRFMKPSYAVGFKANGREKCFHMPFEYTHDQYEGDVFWSMFRELGLVKGDMTFDPPYFKPLTVNADSYKGLSGCICLFPGASAEEKLWPEERWAQTIDRLSEAGYQCLLLGAKKEYVQCDRIFSLCTTGSSVNMCGKLSLHQTARLFEKASLLISTDSGLLHMGVLCNLSTVSLFGSGNAKKWGPKGSRHVIINKELECSPCTQYARIPSCPNARKCIMDITPDDVVNGALSLIRDQVDK